MRNAAGSNDIVFDLANHPLFPFFIYSVFSGNGDYYWFSELLRSYSIEAEEIITNLNDHIERLFRLWKISNSKKTFKDFILSSTGTSYALLYIINSLRTKNPYIVDDIVYRVYQHVSSQGRSRANEQVLIEDSR
jgi:hypothetical protein